MTSPAELPLADQRQLLRIQLQAQRAIIAAQLEPKEAENNAYPRSMIMRFLTQQNGATMLAEGAAVLLGAHWLKSAYTDLLVNIIKPFFTKQKDSVNRRVAEDKALPTCPIKTMLKFSLSKLMDASASSLPSPEMLSLESSS